MISNLKKNTFNMVQYLFLKFEVYIFYLLYFNLSLLLYNCKSSIWNNHNNAQRDKLNWNWTLHFTLRNQNVYELDYCQLTFEMLIYSWLKWFWKVYLIFQTFFQIFIFSGLKQFCKYRNISFFNTKKKVSNESLFLQFLVIILL